MGFEDALDLLVQLLEIGDGSRQPLQLAQVQAHVQLKIGREVEAETVVGRPRFEHRLVAGRIHRRLRQSRIEALRYPAENGKTPLQRQNIPQKQPHEHIQARQHVEIAEEPANIKQPQYGAETHIVPRRAGPLAYQIHQHLGFRRRQTRIQRREHPFGQLGQVHPLGKLVVQRLDEPVSYRAPRQAVAVARQAEIICHQLIEGSQRRRAREQLVHPLLVHRDALIRQTAHQRALDEARHERRPLHVLERPRQRGALLRAHLKHLGVERQRAGGDHPHVGRALRILGNEHGGLLAHGEQAAPDILLRVALGKIVFVQVVEEQDAHVHRRAQLVEYGQAHKGHQLVHGEPLCRLRRPRHRLRLSPHHRLPRHRAAFP